MLKCGLKAAVNLSLSQVASKWCHQLQALSMQGSSLRTAHVDGWLSPLQGTCPNTPGTSQKQRKVTAVQGFAARSCLHDETRHVLAHAFNAGVHEFVILGIAKGNETPVQAIASLQKLFLKLPNSTAPLVGPEAVSKELLHAVAAKGRCVHIY